MLETVDLQKYMFPVEEREVARFPSYDSLLNHNQNEMLMYMMDHGSRYKMIIRKDTDEEISIVPKSYKLVTNEDLINQVLDELGSIDTEWNINPSHSFLQNNRMKLQFDFPNLKIEDPSSGAGMGLSLYLHNSYDMSEGIRMIWGAIRWICSNGVIFGEVLGKFYGRHTKGFRLDNLPTELGKTYDQIPAIQDQIRLLAALPVFIDDFEKLEKIMGKTVMKEASENHQFENQWQLYNFLTYWISHEIAQHLRTQKQIALSKHFKL